MLDFKRLVHKRSLEVKPGLELICNLVIRGWWGIIHIFIFPVLHI